MSTPQTDREPITNKPIYSLAAIVVFVGSMTALYLTDKADGAGVLLAVSAGTLPSLCAALYSERTARDVRNGTIRKKAKEGALEAIETSGVAEAVHDVRAAVADQDAREASRGEPQ